MPATTRVVHDLHSDWTLTNVGGADVPAEIASANVPAEVPGTFHTDLLRAGLIPDPYFGMNEKALEWAHRAAWLYTTEFAATPATEGERVDLVFDGLDTVATVSLNDAEVGRTFNMHRGYRFDVRDLINSGANTLAVRFDSALEYAYEREAVIGDRPRPQPSLELMRMAAALPTGEGGANVDPDDIPKERVYPHPFNAMRKMACSFGWDWGPDLQTAGIWKGVRIERWRTARLAAVRPLATVDGTTGVVDVHVEVERAADDPLQVTVQCAGVEARGRIEPGATTATVHLEVPDAELWWPAGYGDPTLYGITVELDSEDELLDRYEARVGFRTVEIDTSADGDGARFTYVVNGERVFVKGANWIPDDHLMTRVTRDRVRRRFQQALDANMNLIRVWGGGIYETDDFYELADEMGLMVWQDFLFACAAYSEDEVMWAETEAEVRDNVTRLSSHASLVMYNGSNENVWGYFDWGWQPALMGAEWGNRYYDELLPQLLAELDPTRFYTPSSPYSTAPLDMDRHPNDPRWGTVHEWKVWNQIDYTEYASYVPRFCSEFGFQGPAAWSTLEESLPPEGFDQASEIWLTHQKAVDGNDKLNRGFAPHLPGSDDFETWHWITQLNQARAIEFGVEHYRSHWPHCAGSIVWQLNDCWPVTSWAAVDGQERKKPLWYALKHAYAPRLLTFQRRAADGSNDPQGQVHLVAVNDTAEPWEESVTLTRMSLDGTALATATVPLTVAARATATIAIPAEALAVGDASGEVLVADAADAADGSGARALHTFAEDKDVAYAARPFTVEAAKAGDEVRLTVTATGVVRNLTVLADKVSGTAEADDALLDLVPGDVATLTITGVGDAPAEAFTAPRILVSVNSIGK